MFDEVTNTTYRSFEEHSLRLAKLIRSLKPGEAFLQVPGEADIEHLQLDRLIIPESDAIDRSVAKLLDRNYESDLFMSVSEAKVEHEHCLSRLLDMDDRTAENRPGLGYKPLDPGSDNPFVQ